MAKSTQLSIRLELEDRILFELTSDQIDGEITIGRGLDCTWPIPATDRSASSRHARIFKKGSKLILQDVGSRNGVFYMGTRITEQKLSPGEIYGIGDCKLIVEEVLVQDKNAPKEQYHKLEQLTGEARGKMFLLKDPEMKIGAATNSEIYIPDAHVSHLHAIIENHNDGTCWIKDKGSRNGTKINGVMLTKENAETGRMLKDGDIISITYLDFKFWDKNVVHVRSHIFLKTLVVLFTLAVAIGGYLVWQTISPSSKKYRLEAERYAAAEQFDKARELLLKAKDARGAGDDERQRTELVRKLGLWENTYSTWGKIKEHLSKGEEASLYSVNTDFQTLLSSSNENWKWNTESAVAEMKNAQETQELLNNLLTAEERVENSEEDMDFLRKLANNLEKAMATCSANPQPYRGYSLQCANETLTEMKLILKEYDDLQKLLSEYTNAGGTDTLLSEIRKIKREDEERVQKRKKEKQAYSMYISRYCTSLEEPMVLLQKSNNMLTENFQAVVDMKFDKFEKTLPLPSSEQSQVASNFTLRSSELENANIQLGKIIVQLKNYSNVFTQYALLPENNSELMKNFFDKDVLEHTLACDCLNTAMPSFSTKEPTSDYDRMVGVNVLYEYLRSLDSDFDTGVFDDRFEPDVFKAKSQFSMMTTFSGFIKGNPKATFYGEMKRLQGMTDAESPLGKMTAMVDGILARRDRMLKDVYEIYQNDKTTRRGIIAGAMASILKNERSIYIDDKFNLELYDAFKALRKELNKIVNAKNGMNVSVETIEACDRKLLELGVPGDSIIKQAWTDKFSRK
ncbi:MAG: FHA domain-containing protein [Victivallales bacterium]|nr:FHA domain-containing protein [Victivallales bacterium]